MTRQEVISKVSSYVFRKYGGDYRKAFDAEDTDADGRLSLLEVSTILEKSGVGFRLTRWMTAKEIIDLLDTDGDGYVEWAEFDKVLNPK